MEVKVNFVQLSFYLVVYHRKKQNIISFGGVDDGQYVFRVKKNPQQVVC